MKVNRPWWWSLPPAPEGPYRWIAPCVSKRLQRVIQTEAIAGETSVNCSDQTFANRII
jgi:hypothetical protein